MKTEAGGSGRRPRPLVVQCGLVLPPEVLRAELPDVASVLTNATSANSNQPVRPTAPESRSRDPVTAYRERRNVRNILNLFPCLICKKKFPTRDKLNMHWLEHDNQCKRCKAEFDFKDLLLQHKCYHICKETCQCKEYKKHKSRHLKSISSVQNSKLTRENLQIYKKCTQCPICEMKFETKTDLISHKILMKFPCRRCKKCYQTSSEHVVQHQVTSREPAVTQPAVERAVELELICSHCGERFEESLSYSSHVRTHIPAKSYSRARKNAKLKTSQDTIIKASQDKVGNKKLGNSVEEKIVENNIDDNNDPEIQVTDIKDEQCDDIKVEPAEFELVSPKARTILYEGHQIQGEMALGPLRILPDVKRSVEYVTDGKYLGIIKKHDNSVEERRDENYGEVVDIKERDEMEIKTELDDIKLEPAEFEFLSPKARTALHIGHQIRGEMALGPVRIVPDIKRSVEDVTDVKYLGIIKKHDNSVEERLDENDSKSSERVVVDIKECDDMEIKTELDDIKLEPAECEFASPEARTTLYAGHQIRGEMALGPVRILPDIRRSFEDVIDGKDYGNIKKPDNSVEDRHHKNNSKGKKQVVDIKERDDMEIKTELDDIKLEPAECEFVSPEARTTLYAGHQIRGEMALGPVRILPDIKRSVEDVTDKYLGSVKRPDNCVEERLDENDSKGERQVIDIKERDDMEMKTELDDIKLEPAECEFVSPEARTTLYAGHQIRGEMALGPVRILPDIKISVEDVTDKYLGSVKRPNNCIEERLDENDSKGERHVVDIKERDDMEIKTELDDIKLEAAECEFVSPEARTTLYAGHQIRGEMALGPVQILPDRPKLKD